MHIPCPVLICWLVCGKRWFSTLDLASGYWQVSLSPDARCKTAFATHSGLFQFKVMPFGLCNAPATFERLMDRVLQGLRWSRCLVYLDDIISFGTTFDDALDNLTLIFERLCSFGLQLKSTNCHLFQTSVPFLGHVVGREGLHCDPKKIEDVKSWPVPDCLKSVRQFLGFVGYYRRFISNFADVAEPLVSLTGKDVPFVWRPACSTAFTGLRDALVQAPIRSFPTEDGDYILDTDASNFGLGGVLSQIQDNVERVIAYCSRALRPSQRKYCTTKREMLAAVSMCIQFRSYLRGAKFTLRTDHKSLHRFKDSEGMMTLWLHTLQQFQFSIIHRAGREHGNADGLSRAPSTPCKQCTRPDCPTVDTTMKSLGSILGCVKTRTAPYHPESDGMVERFNRTCLMMLSMFVNDRRDNWHELLPFVMHAYQTSVHKSTGYSPFRLMMGEECSLPQDVSTDELRTHWEHDVAPHPFATWVRDALEVSYDHVRHTLQCTAARRKRLYDVKAVNRKFP